MPLENNPQFIGQLNTAWPLGTDPVNNGDNQLRGVKQALQGSFPNLGNKAVTASADQINAVALSSGQYSVGTSTTSLLIGTGTVNFTTQANRGFGVGQKIRLTSQANVANYMQGLCSAYNSTTGAMSVLVDTTGGSGTYADWSVVVYVADSVMRLPRQGRTSNVQLTAADSGYLIDVTSGTFTQTNDAANLLGPSWFVFLENSGTGALTYSGVVYPQGTLLLLQGDGSTVRVYPVRTPDQILSVRDEKASGVSGGTSTASAWTVRDINTVKTNTIPGASIASNKINLPAGTYMVTGSAPAGKTTTRHQARLFNETALASVANGTSEETTTAVITRSFFRDTFTLSVASVLRVEHWVSAGVATTGLGSPTSSGASAEVYLDLEIRKVG